MAIDPERPNEALRAFMTVRGWTVNRTATWLGRHHSTVGRWLDEDATPHYVPFELIGRVLVEARAGRSRASKLLLRGAPARMHW